MDIIIIVVLLAVALLIWRGARLGHTIALWAVALVAMLGLFRLRGCCPTTRPATR